MAVPRLHCNRCGKPTNHELVATREVNESVDANDGSTYSWRNTYEVFACLGCDTICVRDTYADEDEREQVRVYPAPIMRQPPYWRWHLPAEIRELLDEIYAAIQNNAPRVALMGSRALVDMLVVREIGDVGTFTSKLAALEQKGWIGKRNNESLAVALDAGSAAAHRGFKPDPDVLGAVMDIVENLLQAAYHLASSAGKVKGRTPSRRRVN